MTASPLHFATRADRFNRRDGRRPTLREMERLAYPALRSVLRARRGSDDLRGGAAIALGKTGDFEVLDILEALAFEKPGWKAGRITKESAALAFGLMPRVDEEDRTRIAANCLRVFDDKERPARERAWAAIGLGLQGNFAATPALLERFASKDTKPVLKAALAAALGLSGDLRARAALENAVTARGVHDNVRTFACYALGKLGDPAAAALLLQVAEGRRYGQEPKRAALDALGDLAARCDAAFRAKTIAALEKIVRRRDGIFVTGQALVAAGRIANDDAIRLLLKTAKSGRAGERRFAALGLASAVARKRVPEEIRGEIVAALETLSDRVKDAETRSAFLLARGIVRDESAVAQLRLVAGKKGRSPMVRGFACLALGLIGRADDKTTALLRDALTQETNPDLRERAATALGLLRDRRATDVLIGHLHGKRSYTELARTIRALGRVGDHRAIAPLVTIIEDASKSDIVRAIAVAGIGLIGDPTDPPRLHYLKRGYPIGFTIPDLDLLIAIH